MRPSASALFAFGLSVGLAFALQSLPAAAQTHRHKHHPAPAPVYTDDQPPLNVNKRSWLDPGPVVTPGTSDHYVVESSQFARSPDEVYFPSRFHEDAMPRPLYVPGNMTPLVEFEGPRDPFGP